MKKKNYIKNLKELTNNVIDPKNKILEKEIKKNKKLLNKIDIIKNSNLSHIQILFIVKNMEPTICWNARCAFISKSIIDSLINENYYLLRM